MTKPILCLDFDGVIHSYISGWKGAAIIPDAPVPGAIEFIYNAIEHFDVQIFSSRSNQPGGIEAMKGWLLMFATNEITNAHDVKHFMSSIKFPKDKPPAMVSIDDRAITFTGVWPAIETLKQFKPWNKKP